MIEQDKKIRKGLSPQRDATCFRLRKTIVIPAGTILRSIGDHEFAAPVGLGASVTAELKIAVKPGSIDYAAALDRVVA